MKRKIKLNPIGQKAVNCEEKTKEPQLSTGCERKLGKSEENLEVFWWALNLILCYVLP